MSENCTVCNGKGILTVNSSIVDLKSMTIMTTSVSPLCPKCNGKGILLIKPAEIVEDFLNSLKRGAK